MAIKLLLHGKLRDGNADGYRDLAARATALAREEEGTLDYKWLLSDDGHIVNADGYTDESAMFAHVGDMTDRGLLEEYVGLVEIEGFYVFGSVSDETRKALADFNPIYYSLVETL